MRLDKLLYETQLVSSRTRAQALITAGKVLVDGVLVEKPNKDVSLHCSIQVQDDGWVSRAAYKLIGALDESGIEISGRALDAGASTGGFTQVLLSRGIEQVYAVDVGHGQLASILRDDPKVVVKEGLNLRDLTLADVDDQPVDLLTADVSFISLTMILEPMLKVLKPEGKAILLVKPQFELGKKTRKAKGGVVRSPALRNQAIKDVVDESYRLGWRPIWEADSTLPGQDGNVERVIILARQPR